MFELVLPEVQNLELSHFRQKEGNCTCNREDSKNPTDKLGLSPCGSNIFSVPLCGYFFKKNVRRKILTLEVVLVQDELSETREQPELCRDLA